MSKIMIDTGGFETRAAVMEKDRLRQLEIERKSAASLVGNIYKARVVRVLKGLNAAFLNIGESREAFLPLADAREEFVVDGEIVDEDGGDGDKARGRNDDGDKDGDKDKDKGKGKGRAGAEKGGRAGKESLKISPGDYVLVQLVKDAIGNKGPKVTANNISMPGNLVVFLPYQKRRGVSRRISGGEKRDQLMKAAAEVFPGDGGFIIRTQADHHSESVIQQEARGILQQWEKITRDYRKQKGPARLHAEAELPVRFLRDCFGPEVEQVIVDSPSMAKTCRKYLSLFGIDPRKVSVHRDKKPLFTALGVEDEIKKALARKVPLEGGGHLVIEETEALCAVDVNTGRAGGSDYRNLILKINLLAAEEIAWQLRLRNMGGIIVVDFIDMSNPRDRRRVFDVFEKALEPDKARIKILRISRLGLVEMTRQRTRESLRGFLADDCPVCGGTGVVLSPETVSAAIRREFQVRFPVRRIPLLGGARVPRVELRVAPSLHQYLVGNLSAVFPERPYRNRLKLVLDNTLSPDEYHIG